MYDTDDIEVREVAGGHVGWSDRGTDEWAADLERRCDRLNAPQAPVRESAARFTAPGLPRSARTLDVQTWCKEVLGTSTRVRESTHPLGRVLSGEHAHGAVRHSHDRLSDDHEHCVQCGGDFRLCLQNRRHAEGTSPAREANSNPWTESVERMFDGETSAMTPARAMGELWQMEHAGQERSGQEGRELAAAFERAIGDGGPRR